MINLKISNDTNRKTLLAGQLQSNKPYYLVENTGTLSDRIFFYSRDYIIEIYKNNVFISPITEWKNQRFTECHDYITIEIGPDK